MRRIILLVLALTVLAIGASVLVLTLPISAPASATNTNTTAPVLTNAVLDAPTMNGDATLASYDSNSESEFAPSMAKGHDGDCHASAGMELGGY